MDEVWWKQVTSANRLIRGIKDSLLEERSVILTGVEGIPWPETFRRLIGEEVTAADYNRTLRIVDAEEIGPDLGAYLLKKFCQGDLQRKFRPGKGGHAKFLAECEGSTLPNVYLWIREANAKLVRDWVNFLGDYYNYLGKAAGLVFFIEQPETKEPPRRKGVQLIAYEKEISHYDYYVFNMLMAGEGAGDVNKKQYLAELVSHIVEADSELSGRCVKAGEVFLEKPYESYAALSREREQESGVARKVKSSDEVEHAVWNTQIRTVFPLIEEYRRRFIKRREKFIRQSLPHQDGSGNIIRQPQEAEVGILHFLASKDQWALTPHEWEELSLCHEARNSLAHMQTLSYEQIKGLLNV